MSTVARATGAVVLVAVLGLAPAASSATGTGSPSSSTSRPGGSGGAGGSDASGGFPMTTTSADGVEVTTYGVATIRAFQDAANPPAVVAVHGVRRVPDATIVYLSVGYAADDAEDSARPGALEELAEGRPFSGGGQLSMVRLTDPSTSQVFTTVTSPEQFPPGNDVAFGSRVGAFPDRAGVMAALYAVLPELPAETTTVTVTVGTSASIAGVPVADGALQPTVETDDPTGEVIPLGTGWPDVDPADLRRVTDAATSTYPLTSVVQALDGTTTNRETGDSVTVDVAADVLFAFDSAELSPQAQTTLNQVAIDIVQRAAPGAVSIVGHTDSTADDAYNDDLSLRRAQAVAAVLGPRLTGAGLTLAVEGRGEREPVATNETDEGRQANRRVSVTFTQATGAAQ